MKPYILVVDDEPDIRHLVKDILEDEGYEVSVAENGTAARLQLQARTPDLTLLDIWMPDVDGITLLKEFTMAGHNTPVVMISGHGTVETAVEATRLGAFDFVEKPLSMGKLLTTVERAIAEMRKPKTEGVTGPGKAVPEPVGHSEVMRTLRARAAKVAEQRNTVLIYGEPGAGKSMFARYIHGLSDQASGPFLTVNLASLETEQIHKVLFGNGLGTAEASESAFVQARGGTLFINNVSVAELSVQTRLAEILSQEENDISVRHAVGTLPRLIVATSEDVRPLVDVGQFRRDLYYKLNETPLWIPPLRDHREDVPELLGYFVDLAMAENQLPYRKFSFAAQNWLRNYSWLGNALEMKNLVKSLLVLGNEADIEVDEVKAILGHNFAVEPSGTGDAQQDFELPLREARERFEKAYLEFHLRAANGNVGVVARKAGMERTHLYRKFRALGIDPKNIRHD